MNNHEEKDPLLMDHDADGITELDNNLPRWWVWLFVLCCVWALGYMVYFHVMGGPDQLTVYQREMARAEAAVAAHAAAVAAAAPAPEAVVEGSAPGVDLTVPGEDEAVLASGRDIYMKNCMVCHAADGGGLIGPNMTDDYYIHGATFADSIRIIEEGVLAKGMISWKAVLKPEEIHAVASYIWTMRGTTPAVAKAPEGEQVTM
jgi:cytochrome c oxidase cbb3-type subunit 3